MAGGGKGSTDILTKAEQDRQDQYAREQARRWHQFIYGTRPTLELAQIEWKKKWFPRFLALAIVVVLATVTILVLYLS